VPVAYVIRQFQTRPLQLADLDARQTMNSPDQLANDFLPFDSYFDVPLFYHARAGAQIQTPFPACRPAVV
jgi:hypothetical protein